MGFVAKSYRAVRAQDYSFAIHICPLRAPLKLSSFELTILFVFVFTATNPCFGESRENHKPSTHRETVQVAGGMTDLQKTVSQPTWTVHAGIPRSFHFHSSLALASPGPALSGLWKQNIVATVFWVGEPSRESDPGNLQSAWDNDWIHTAKNQNPFYVALPYNDVQNGHTKPEARSIIPWFSAAFVRDGQSVLKDRWVAIRKGNLVCYAQWEDVGPCCVDHWQYVFGSERPRPNQNRDAGIDVSPAVRDFLGMSGMDFCDWRFASEDEIPPGPWRVSVSPEPALPRLLEGLGNGFLLPERSCPLLQYSVNPGRETLAGGALRQRSDLIRQRTTVYTDSPDPAEMVMNLLRR
jgi:hypothetical protein